MSSLASTDALLGDFATDVGPAENGPIAVAGSRTRWDIGGPLAPTARIVEAPTGIVSYQPEEMTVVVRAGTTVQDLHAVLADAGQRSALPERGGTVGGALAVGENHLELLGRGRVRDAALQVRYVSADGEVVTSGGPTVKNVTGFNLPAVMVGSLGALGLIAEVTLRTNPTPPASRWLTAKDADPIEAFDSLLRPSSVLWDGHQTWVHLEGHLADVDAESEKLSAVADFSETPGPPPAPLHRWSVRPDEITSPRPEAGAFLGAIGVGILQAEQPQPSREPDGASVVIAERMKRLFDPTGRLSPGRNPSIR